MSKVRFLNLLFAAWYFPYYERASICSSFPFPLHVVIGSSDMPDFDGFVNMNDIAS